MAMTSSIYYLVPIMRQPQTWACWYTSLQMVVAWHRSRRRGRPGRLIDPSQDAETRAMYAANRGIRWRDNERIARQLGFECLFACETNEGMWELLRDHGPVIYSGQWPGASSGHWVVIVGISASTLCFNDPANGQRTMDYNRFMGQYLTQHELKPLMYAP